MDQRIALIFVLALAVCGVSCGTKTGKASHTETSAVVTSSVTDSTQSETEDGASVTTAVSSVTTASESKAVSGTTTSQTAASAGADINFSYDKNGAVQFEEDSAAADDQTLMAAAQALYESACKTQWNFTVGSPYDLDMSDYVENQYQWQFYRVKDAGINSLADVRNDYHKVFSDKYPDELDTLYIEKDGNVYALNGARGANIFYGYSKITSVNTKNNDEIFFTVTNYYDETEFGGEGPYSEDEEFSAVIGPDGVWRAGKFRLPY